MIVFNGIYYVYAHVNKINAKVYVGITCNSPEIRWNSGRNYKHCPHFYNAIMKYGWNNFDHEIIASKLTEAEAKYMEKLLIKKLQSTNREFGYNVLEGGQSTPHPESVRNKISESMKIVAREAEHKKRFIQMLNKLNSSGLNVGKSKPVRCVETGAQFPNAVVAGDIMNIKGGGHSITNMLNGWQKSAGGYHFEYIIIKA